MSGPKTSELEIEQRRHALMEELRTLATDARAHAIRMIEEACRHAEEAAAAAGREELAHEAADVAARAADEVRRQTRFEVGADLEAARAAVEELTRAAEKTASTARARLEVIVDDARTAASRQEDLEQDAAFERYILANRSGGRSAREAAAALAAASNPHTSDPSDRGIGNEVSNDNAHRDEKAAASAVCIRLRRIIESGTLFGVDLAHACTALEALERTFGEEGRPSEQSASLAGAAADALAVYTARARDGAALLDQIAALEDTLSQLGETPPPRPPFDDAEAACAYADNLRRRVRDADQRSYLRACIDEIMASHGYDIARSVALGPAGAGSHVLYLSQEDGGASSEGIHAFTSNDGDLMLEVVGIGFDPDDIPSEVSTASAAGQARQAELLEAQTGFCAVYADIEEELAAYGITSTARHRAKPDVSHCKELVAADGTRSHAAGSVREQGGGAHRRTRRKAAPARRAREMKAR